MNDLQKLEDNISKRIKELSLLFDLFVKESENRRIRKPRPALISQGLINAYCAIAKEKFNITLDDLRGDSRKVEVVCLRHYLMAILKENTLLSLKEIGELLGGRDHSTVINGITQSRSREAIEDELYFKMIPAFEILFTKQS